MLWHSRKFKMPILELNALYHKIQAQALDDGVSTDLIRDALDALDPSLNYDEATESLAGSLGLRDCPRKAPPMDARTCVRCGEPYSYVEAREKNGQTYFYAVHRQRASPGHAKIHKCYLGAKRYRYVKLLHKDSDIILTGAVNKDRYIEYLESVLGHLAGNELDSEQRDKVKDLLKRYKGEF